MHAYFIKIMRLDLSLALQYGLTRNKSQQLIGARLVFVNGNIIEKTSFEVSENDTISIQDDRRVRWVSRSAEKLAGFLSHHPGISTFQSRCVDVGSSTGGFTQVLLEYGAIIVDAIDVGTDQLHEHLRLDPRVQSYEQTDIRTFVPTESAPYDIIVCDVSFISLIDIIDSILAFADVKTDIILLFKPQFEVGKEYLRKTGVPKTEASIDVAKRRFEEALFTR